MSCSTTAIFLFLNLTCTTAYRHLRCPLQVHSQHSSYRPPFPSFSPAETKAFAFLSSVITRFSIRFRRGIPFGSSTLLASISPEPSQPTTATTRYSPFHLSTSTPNMGTQENEEVVRHFGRHSCRFNCYIMRKEGQEDRHWSANVRQVNTLAFVV